MISPGATLGMVGGGQLGRYFAIAAQQMGYRVMVLDPDPASPAGRVADEHLCAPFEDEQALRRMGESCAVITTEWENVSADVLDSLSRYTQVCPNAAAVAIPQHRIREKRFIESVGLSPVPWLAIESDADTQSVDLDFPAILKTAELGYDGKGQVSVSNPDALFSAWERLGQRACVLEQRVELAAELSVVLARQQSGETRCFPVAENQHVNGILHQTVVPARAEDGIQKQAQQAAVALADTLSYVGVMAVEFFVTTAGELLVNEIAPRTHNSGHYTLDACITSQFAQQVRTICGLPLGDVQLKSSVSMVNVLGDLWQEGEPDWTPLFEHPQAVAHFYGKSGPRPGRKMGHFNLLSDDAVHARRDAEAVYKGLVS